MHGDPFSRADLVADVRCAVVAGPFLAWANCWRPLGEPCRRSPQRAPQSLFRRSRSRSSSMRRTLPLVTPSSRPLKPGCRASAARKLPCDRAVLSPIRLPTTVARHAASAHVGNHRRPECMLGRADLVVRTISPDVNRRPCPAHPASDPRRAIPAEGLPQRDPHGETHADRLLRDASR